MLYSINTIILDTRTNQFVEGAVVIDLYVNTEAEANRNIFARDVMNLPVIKAGLQRYDEAYHLPSPSSWQAHPAQIYNYQHEFVCIYQENNEQTFSRIKKFRIKVLFDTSSNYCPLTTQYLTYNNFYDAYEIAWHRFLLGKVPCPLKCRAPEVNDNFIIVYPHQVDIARVINVANQTTTVVVNDNDRNPIIIGALHQTWFHAIPLFDDLLITQFGFTPQILNVQDQTNAECLVKTMMIQAQQTTVILRKDGNGYMCSTDNAQISTGLIHVAYLSELQSVLHHYLTVATGSLLNYLNALLRQYFLVTKLLEQYNAETNLHPNYTRQQIITELSKHFGVSVGIVEAEMNRQYL